MKRMLTIGLRAAAVAAVLSCCGAIAAWAADETPRQVFHGTLVDAGCLERPACPVTGGTRAFALELPDGRLLDLGEAGATFASAALNGSKDGRDLINRVVYSIRPQATVTGQLHGYKVIVDSVTIE
ncbi:MAG: hypothetical protein ACLQVN_19860 [Bryobacteraceae bacterium]